MLGTSICVCVLGFFFVSRYSFSTYMVIYFFAIGQVIFTVNLCDKGEIECFDFVAQPKLSFFPILY